MNKLVEQCKTKAVISVGVFADHSPRKEGELTNATLAAIHEYGSPEHHLPARSMLRVPIHDHAQDIINVFKGKCEAYLAKGTFLNLMKLVGIQAEKIVDGAFDSGGYGKWAPLKYETLLGKLRKGHKDLHWRKLTIAHIYAGNIGMAILIRTAQLRRSFSSRVKLVW